HEYEEGVSEGKVKEMIEYQDAQGFAARAEAIFKSVESKINEHSREELEKWFADLNNAINSAQDPDKVETFIDAIVNELREVAGIEETAKEITSQQYVENARQLLKQVSVEYKNGNFTGADKLAVFAYLENFEYVESDLAKNGAEDLMGQIEQMMRVELRDMIKNRVTQDKLDSHIDAIDAKLKEAYVVVPEFPVGLTVALASIVGAVVALTRIKGHNLRMP
ncbi:MAG: PEFG-CTERM sorting domain-containing protein, partial [Nitrososphaerales archaeon]